MTQNDTVVGGSGGLNVLSAVCDWHIVSVLSEKNRQIDR